MAKHPLTDIDIRDVAARLLQAMRAASASGGSADREAFPELSPEDERRVLAAMTELRRADAPAGARRAPEEGAEERKIGSDHTSEGSAARSTQGYGTSQGASGATSGGADPGGSVNSPPA